MLRFSRVDRQIMQLAFPALATLVIHPSLLLVDSAIVGHWSTQALAGLGLAQTVLFTIVGLCVFLAYSTTSSVAKALGAGDPRRALRCGLDAIWLGAILGLVAGVATWISARGIISLFSASPDVAEEAVRYLTISTLGLPAMLVFQSATGIIRGLQNTTVPLLVSAVGAVINAPLSFVLVHGARLGVAGAAIGTVVCETGMAVALTWVVIRKAGALDVALTARLTGITAAWKDGVPLLIRTLALRVSLIMLTVAASRLGTIQLAAHQIVWNIWGFLANGLDALAIAAQALTGMYLGRRDYARARRLTRRLCWWGVGTGTVTSLVVAAATFIAPTLFSPDPLVQEAVQSVWLVVVVSQPLAGFVFVLDGILMGAGDGRYLAWASLVVFAFFAPAILGVIAARLPLNSGLVAVWLSMAIWMMGLRGVTLWWRIRRDDWMRVTSE